MRRVIRCEPDRQIGKTLRRLLVLLSLAAVGMAQAANAAVDNIPSTPQSANIFAYPDDYLAVQLLAVRKKSAILEFLAANDLGDPPYGAMYSNGRIWYVLLLGIYPDRAAARAAIARMPATTPPVEPWIRPLGQLLGAVRQARDHLASKAGEEERQEVVDQQ